MSPSRFFLVLAALLGFFAVAAGAFGAHVLEAHLDPKDLTIFETAVRYQMYHALALLGVAILAQLSERPSRALSAAGWCFLAGTLIFSGSLYFLVLTGPRWLGAITPIGGVALLAGWVCLAVAALRR
jgi:uncharacterized membrane protein YgdD (TMEM256/DUF423 family)